MLIYWILLAFPALMAIAYPVSADRARTGPAQGLALAFFLVLYTGIAALRFETGGDWLTYDLLYDDIRTDTFAHALSVTDPLYGLLNWIGAETGLGIYFVNAVCGWVLSYGVVKVALRFREPWLAITMAVPYLLIVVGLGYVRQGAAIGVILLAIASFDQSKPLRTLIYLMVAMAFHATAVVTLPMFTYAVTARHKMLGVLIAVLGVAVFYLLLAPRIEVFEAGYVANEYDSGGTLTRLLMSLIPSLLLLLRWRNFGTSVRVRSVWVSIAIANFAALAALGLVSSSTAVDRIALFFSPIQIAVMGEFRSLVPLARRFTIPTRLALIAVAAMVQVVWLVYATHAEFWVPYRSVLEFL
ncbi:MAG: EpsG family protein [Novosphingobium sp.]